MQTLKNVPIQSTYLVFKVIITCISINMYVLNHSLYMHVLGFLDPPQSGITPSRIGRSPPTTDRMFKNATISRLTPQPENTTCTHVLYVYEISKAYAARKY